MENTVFQLGWPGPLDLLASTAISLKQSQLIFMQYLGNGYRIPLYLSKQSFTNRAWMIIWLDQWAPYPSIM